MFPNIEKLSIDWLKVICEHKNNTLLTVLNALTASSNLFEISII
jgi:hypothetical protein